MPRVVNGGQLAAQGYEFALRAPDKQDGFGLYIRFLKLRSSQTWILLHVFLGVQIRISGSLFSETPQKGSFAGRADLQSTWFRAQ